MGQFAHTRAHPPCREAILVPRISVDLDGGSPDADSPRFPTVRVSNLTVSPPTFPVSSETPTPDPPLIPPRGRNNLRFPLPIPYGTTIQVTAVAITAVGRSCYAALDFPGAVRRGAGVGKPPPPRARQCRQLFVMLSSTPCGMLRQKKLGVVHVSAACRRFAVSTSTSGPGLSQTPQDGKR
jgi:hypothetical protein